LLSAPDDTDGRVSGLTVTVKLCVALRLACRCRRLSAEQVGRIGLRDQRPPVDVRVGIVDLGERSIAGPLNRLTVRVCGGESVSVALAVTTMFEPTLAGKSATGFSTGGVLDGRRDQQINQV